MQLRLPGRVQNAAAHDQEHVIPETTETTPCAQVFPSSTDDDWFTRLAAQLRQQQEQFRRQWAAAEGQHDWWHQPPPVPSEKEVAAEVEELFTLMGIF